MSSEINRQFSLVIFNDGSNVWDIVPHDSIKLSENSSIGECLVAGKLTPLRIIQTSEHIEYLMSVLIINENEANNEQDLQFVLNNLSNKMTNEETLQNKVEDNNVPQDNIKNIKQDETQNQHVMQDKTKHENNVQGKVKVETILMDKIKNEYVLQDNIKSENLLQEERKTKLEIKNEYTVYPYMIYSNKVKLVTELDVWISEEALQALSPLLNTKPILRRQAIVQCLLQELVGIENMRRMWRIETEYYQTLPQIVFLAIKEFLKNNLKIKNSFRLNTIIDKVLLNARKDTYKILPVTDIDETLGSEIMDLRSQKQIVFPYTVKTPNKVHFLPNCNVLIKDKEMEFIEDMCDDMSPDKGKIIFYLLTTLLGPNNISYVKIDGRTCIRIPQDVYLAILTFVNRKCKGSCQLSETQFDSHIRLQYLYAWIFKSNQRQSQKTTASNQKPPIPICINEKSLEDYFFTQLDFIPSEIPNVIFKTDVNFLSPTVTTIANNQSHLRVSNSRVSPTMTPVVKYDKRKFYDHSLPVPFGNCAKRQRMCTTEDFYQSHQHYLLPYPMHHFMEPQYNF